MECVSGSGNWKLTWKEKNGEAVILRAVTCDTIAVLPEEINGLPVSTIGDHALAYDARPILGNELLMTCGVPSDDWDNRKILELTIPSSIRKIENYGFINLRELKRLRLTDTTVDWGTGALMNCRYLQKIDLFQTQESRAAAMSYIAENIPKELHVTLYSPEGGQVRLVLPEYYEDFEESICAHIFVYKLSGSGYLYHALFNKGDVSLTAYDSFFDKFLQAEHEEEAALRLAWYRLRYPRDLSEAAESRYETYLSSSLKDVLKMVIDEEDLEGLSKIIEHPSMTRETLSEARDYALDRRLTAASALLLEKQQSRFGGRRAKSYDL